VRCVACGARGACVGACQRCPDCGAAATARKKMKFRTGLFVSLSSPPLASQRSMLLNAASVCPLTKCPAVPSHTRACRATSCGFAACPPRGTGARARALTARVALRAPACAAESGGSRIGRQSRVGWRSPAWPESSPEAGVHADAEILGILLALTRQVKSGRALASTMPSTMTVAPASAALSVSACMRVKRARQVHHQSVR
jgi:hypothetical protein